MKFYAGIGSRKTPSHILVRMENFGLRFARKGWILRSGGAIGADRAFAEYAHKKEIYKASQPLPLWTKVFVEYFHPNPDALHSYPFALMQRNAMQILGKDGNTPVEFVVCWTEGGKWVGGTSQALRIADYFKIPIFNFYNQSDIDKLRDTYDNSKRDNV